MAPPPRIRSDKQTPSTAAKDLPFHSPLNNSTSRRRDKESQKPLAIYTPTDVYSTLSEKRKESKMPQHYTRASILPTSTIAASQSTSSSSTTKTRQYAQLQAQLAQLNANLADTENLLRMTAVQAGDIRFLGGYVGALFMGGAKVLGEEGVKHEQESGPAQSQNQSHETGSTADSGSES